MESEEKGDPPDANSQELCYGSSKTDEIATIPVAFICFVLIVWIAYTSVKNLKNIKQQALLKWLLWTAIISGLLETILHIIIESLCLATGEYLFEIAWIPLLCYGLLFLLSKTMAFK